MPGFDSLGGGWLGCPRHGDLNKREDCYLAFIRPKTGGQQYEHSKNGGNGVVGNNLDNRGQYRGRHPTSLNP